MGDKIIFRQITSTKPIVKYLEETINTHLDMGQKVLWLVPGGSSINIATEVSKLLSRNHLSNLVVTLTDERYGPIGHKDSNWLQLKKAGFSLPKAKLIPLLGGDSLGAVVRRYNNVITDALKTVDYSLGLFGVGGDGHITGVKPGSSAVNSEDLAAGYAWEDYTRITMTPRAIKMLDEAVVYMVGEEKHEVIKSLGEENVPIEEQPAQILKQLKKVTVYNDYLGENT
ncbi:MAG TPA: 6-phosphogluconolactonase [Candidatus Saccharimonadales bacterium]|nr:6-phosphogluconolactonase [Candidatus Saccharimonadales bacterium]